MSKQKVLTEEDYKFLKELGTELKTQDNLATQKPVFYQIYEKKQNAGYDPQCHAHCIALGDDFSIFVDINEAKKFITKYYNLKQGDLLELESADNFQDLVWWCEELDIPAMLTGYKEEYKKTGVFLTQKACREHIKRNSHHYAQGEDTKTYCNHAWRNPELKRLLEIVEKFAEEE